MMAPVRQGGILAIDQGASKTQVLLADTRGHLLAAGRGPGACWSTSGMDQAMDGLRLAMQDLAIQAKADLPPICQAVAGMSGVDWPGDDRIVEKALSGALGLTASQVRVVNDCVIALRAGAASAAGAVLCAGTGFNCAVRNGMGQEWVFGYYVHDDCQGGSALGLRAIQAVIDMESGLRRPTGLIFPVLNAMECKTPMELLRKKVEGRLHHDAVCALPRFVEAAALKGDDTANELLYQLGADMADYAVAGLKKLNMTAQKTEVVLSGSLFKCRAAALCHGVQERLRQGAPLAEIRQSKLEPVVGGILLALDALDQAPKETIEQEAAGLGLTRMV